MNHCTATEMIFLLKALLKFICLGLLNILEDKIPYPLWQEGVPKALQWGHILAMNQINPKTDMMI